MSSKEVSDVQAISRGRNVSKGERAKKIEMKTRLSASMAKVVIGLLEKGEGRLTYGL